MTQKRPNGTIRYIYEVCDDKGEHCANEMGRIEATIDNVILPEEKKEWECVVRKAGNAVANEMRNSRHEMPTTNLMKINIEKKSREKETIQREEERDEASQRKLTKLSQNMSREEKIEWFARFEDITGPVQQSLKDEAENVLPQNIDQSIFDELNSDLTITNITPISRSRMICYHDDSTNVTPGQKRKETVDEEPTETDELRELNRPLVVIE